MDINSVSTGSHGKKDNKYIKVKLLGKGAFGTVYLIKCKNTNELRVLKEIDMNEMDQKEKEGCLREAKILEILTHSFIVGYRDVFKTKGGKLCIIMDYCEKGDLDKEIKRRAEHYEKTNDEGAFFSDEEVLTWFAQICFAIKQVHHY